MTRLTTILAATLALLTPAVHAADAPPPLAAASAPAPTTEPSDFDKVTCKREVATGSRIASVKVCTSARARQEQAQGWRKWMNDIPSTTSAQ